MLKARCCGRSLRTNTERYKLLRFDGKSLLLSRVEAAPRNEGFLFANMLDIYTCDALLKLDC